MSETPPAHRSLPRGVWALGLVSLCMDTSSELIHSLLPLYLTGVLGAGMVTVGLIEGVAEATAAVAKVFSGALSDWFGRRKPLVLLGYGLAALTKPIFPLANSVGWVFTARFIDRIGKGIRGAPRDALVADITPADRRGAAYGLRQALDSVGALLGPLLAIIALAVLSDDLRGAMWLAVVPAFLAVALLAIAVREPPGPAGRRAVRMPLHWRSIRQLPSPYWLVVALGALFTLARFSEAFLVLRAESVGISLVWIPLVMIVMNLFYAGLAFPAGHLSDHVSRRRILVIGLLVLIAADVLLALADSPGWVVAGAALWGIHMALTQGLLSKLVADTSPSELRGTAFGFFNLVSGVALLLASLIAGGVWSLWGPSATFFAGALFAAITVTGLLVRTPLRS